MRLSGIGGIIQDNMSRYSRDKCSAEQLDEFKKKVFDYLRANGVKPKKLKIRCQKNYDGNIKILTHCSEFPNRKKSIRKDDESPTGYSRSVYSQKMWMGIYFYRSEWESYYLKDEQKDQREWDLADIKKLI